MGGTQTGAATLDFSDLGGQQVAAAPSAKSMDFSDLGGKQVSSARGTTSPYWDDLKDQYGLPHSIDLSKSYFENWANIGKPNGPTSEEFNRADPQKFAAAYQAANPDVQPTTFWGRTWDELKRIEEGAFGGGFLQSGFNAGANASAPTLTPDVMAPVQAMQGLRDRAKEFATNPAAASGATAADLFAMAAPLAFDENLWRGRPSPVKTIEESLGRRITPVEADTPRPGGTNFPALNNTPREVLAYARKIGVNLTPGQALEDPFALQLQETGKASAPYGRALNRAILDSRGAFEGATADMMDRFDPQRTGISAETAGENIQHEVRGAMERRQSSANQAYNQVANVQSNLSGDIGGLKDLAAQRRTETITSPTTGQTATRPIYQSPAVENALQDIEGAPDRLGPNPSMQSMRNLRTELWEKGNDRTGNIPDAAKALYKQAAGKVDDAMMAAGQGTPFEDSFRQASGLWKDLQQKYNTPGSVMYKVLQQSDPTKIVSLLQHAPATDIDLMKQEGLDAALNPLRRQVLSDIASRGFGVRGGELAGYSDNYLRSLFGRGTTKELYLHSDLANRLRYNANPSGTGPNITSASQFGAKEQVKAAAAAKMSMPRDPLSYLGSGPRSAIQTTPFGQSGPLATSAGVALLEGDRGAEGAQQ